MGSDRSEGPARGQTGPADSWDRRMGWLLAGLVLFRLVYAALFPLDLAPDESYYWDWGRRPDIGYFSKPPMIGWLMGLAGWLGDDSQFMLKWFPGLLSTGGLGFVYLLGRELYGARAGWMAVGLLLASPGNAALSIFFTIDAPLFLCWNASLWWAWRWLRAPGFRPGALLVLALGAGFLTKQIQLVFPPLLAAAILTLPSQARPPRWKSGLILIGLASLVFLLPPLVWNWQHGWITFRHTADEISHNPLQLGRSLRFLGEFIGGQAGLGGLVPWGCMMAALFAVVRGWRAADERARFLVVFALPGLLAYTAFALKQRVEQNWPMVFYTSAALLAAGHLEAAMPSGGKRVPRLFRRAVAVGGGLALLTLLLPFVLPRSPLSGAKADPTGRIRGWRELAKQIQTYRSLVPEPAKTILIAPDDRYVASALAFYLPDRPRTFCWEDEARPESQYGIWGRPRDRLGWDALVIAANPDSVPARDLSGRFQSWEKRGEIVIELGIHPDRNRRYSVFLGRRLGSTEPRKPGD